MINVGTHGLTCLDGSDPAAVALSMQANSAAMTSALGTIGGATDSYLDRWYWSATNGSSMSIANNSGTVLPEGETGADLFTDGGPLTVAANGFPATASFPITQFWPPGIYLAGTSIKWTVATPNNNTFRILMLTSVNRVNGSANIAYDWDELYKATDYEHSAAGNDGSLEVVGLMKIGSDISRIAACFSHANTSSTLNVAPGAWRLWFIFLGSGLVI